MRWEPRGEDQICLFRGFAFTLSPDERGTWLYVETDGPGAGNHQFPAQPRYFPRTALAHAFIKRVRRHYGI